LERLEALEECLLLGSSFADRTLVRDLAFVSSREGLWLSHAPLHYVEHLEGSADRMQERLLNTFSRLAVKQTLIALPGLQRCFTEEGRSLAACVQQHLCDWIDIHLLSHLARDSGDRVAALELRPRANRH